MKKNIVCVTGCRSEYDILYPVVKLLKIGEEPRRVFDVGDPAIDRFSEIKKMTKREVLKIV